MLLADGGQLSPSPGIALTQKELLCPGLYPHGRNDCIQRVDDAEVHSLGPLRANSASELPLGWVEVSVLTAAAHPYV